MLSLFDKFIPRPCYGEGAGAGAGAGGGNSGGAGQGHAGGIGSAEGGYGGFGGTGGIGAGVGSDLGGGSGVGRGGTQGNFGGDTGLGPSTSSLGPSPSIGQATNTGRSTNTGQTSNVGISTPTVVAPAVRAPTVRAPTVRAPTVAPTPAPVAPVTAAVADFYGPNAMMSVPSTPSQVSQQATARSQAASPNTSMGPMSVAGTVSSSGYGQSTSSPAGPAANYGASPADNPGARGGPSFSGGPQSNASAKGNFGGGMMGSMADGPSNMGVGAAAGIGNQSTPSNASAKGNFGNFAGQVSNAAAKSDIGVPGLNANANLDALAAQQIGQQLASVASKNSLAPGPVSAAPQSVAPGLSTLSDDEISATINAIVNNPNVSTVGLSPVGTFATNAPTQASLAAAALAQGLAPASQYGRAAPSPATPNSIGVTPGATMTSGKMFDGRLSPGISDNNFYGQPANVSFPDVSTSINDPAAYSQTPQGAWSKNTQSFASPMEAFNNMGLMDQARAAAMFGGFGKARAGGLDGESILGFDNAESILGFNDGESSTSPDNGNTTDIETVLGILNALNQWTPPGLLYRPYSNPWATRNPWLTA